MGFYDAFFGSDQSLYTAYAIIAAIIAICVTILFTSTDIPIGSRLLMILFVIITLVPSIFLTLFEITCIVTGGTEPNNWWCYTFGWILAAFIIIYCIFVVIISIVSLITYNKAIDNVNNEEQKNKVNPQEANNIAKQIMATQKPVEKFYNDPEMNFSIQNMPDFNLTSAFANAMSNNSPQLTPDNKAEFYGGPPAGSPAGSPADHPAGPPAGSPAVPPPPKNPTNNASFYGGSPNNIKTFVDGPAPALTNKGKFTDLDNQDFSGYDSNEFSEFGAPYNSN